MSHACVIVALDPSIPITDEASIQEAISYQMHPFDENGEWFADGSRWDWWTIGGRFSGFIAGKDIVRRGDITEESLRDHNIARAHKLWNEFEAEPAQKQQDSFIRGYVYGLDPEETREKTVEKFTKRPLSAYAFLKDRKWFESKRMGWFGCGAATECEIASGGEWTERCVTKDEATKSMIATFVGPKDSEDQWKELYWARFIRPLPADTILVAVDYHV